MKQRGFRYSGIGSSRSCAENPAALRNLPMKVFGIFKGSQKFSSFAYGRPAAMETPILGVSRRQF